MENSTSFRQMMRSHQQTQTPMKSVRFANKSMMIKNPNKQRMNLTINNFGTPFASRHVTDQLNQDLGAYLSPTTNSKMRITFQMPSPTQSPLIQDTSKIYNKLTSGFYFSDRQTRKNSSVMGRTKQRFQIDFIEKNKYLSTLSQDKEIKAFTAMSDYKKLTNERAIPMAGAPKLPLKFESPPKTVRYQHSPARVKLEQVRIRKMAFMELQKEKLDLMEQAVAGNMPQLTDHEVFQVLKMPLQLAKKMIFKRQIDYNQNQAAIKIQRAFRRFRFKKRRQIQKLLMERSALKIQTRWRAYKVRKEFKIKMAHLNFNATIIQKYIRGFQVYRYFLNELNNLKI